MYNPNFDIIQYKKKPNPMDTIENTEISMNTKDSNFMVSVQLSIMGNNYQAMKQMVDNGLAFEEKELNKDTIRFNFTELEKYLSF